MKSDVLLLGLDIGSSYIKAAIVDAKSGKHLASASSPDTEMAISSPSPGWAEQNPEMWWQNTVRAINLLRQISGADFGKIKAIGISYQMHGLVLLDKDYQLLHPAIIWCDSRASEIGRKAFFDLGGETCLEKLLNSPGNFTASKLKWVIENNPLVYNQIHKIMLPGDYIAMKLTNEISTTVSGLSEMVLWDYSKNQIADMVLDYYGIDRKLIPDVADSFSVQGQVNRQVADSLGINPQAVVSYRAGDQPNNAFSLKVLNKGEIAATAGTSGVVYGITDKPLFDDKSRVNGFVHVNHCNHAPKYGILLCVNGSGILNTWVKNNFAVPDHAKNKYEYMNKLAQKVPAGCENLVILPFGNGSERILDNKNIHASIHNIDFNIHRAEHIFRAAQEGVLYALYNGLQIMENIGMEINKIRVGNANMFLSPIFQEGFSALSGAVLEIYDTDGAQGAARGAGFGAGIFINLDEAFAGLNIIKEVFPDKNREEDYMKGYKAWLKVLEESI